MSLLLVNFNLGEDLNDKINVKHIKQTVSCMYPCPWAVLTLFFFYQETPIFIL